MQRSKEASNQAFIQQLNYQVIQIKKADNCAKKFLLIDLLSYCKMGLIRTEIVKEMYQEEGF